MVGDQLGDAVELAVGEHPHQHRCSRRVDQARRDSDVAVPQVFEMQRCGAAVHADVGDVAAGADDRRRQFEGRGNADGLDRHVGAASAGHGFDDVEGVLASVVDGDVRAEQLGRGEPAVGLVDRHDGCRAEQARTDDCRDADRSCADDGDHITGATLPLRTPIS